MEDPANGVVDCLALGERLVTALVGNDPEASRKEADKEGVERPEHEARGGVEVGVGQRDVLWGEERVEEVGELVEAQDDDTVHDTGQGMSMTRDDTSQTRVEDVRTCRAKT